MPDNHYICDVKHFKSISAIFIIVIAVIFGCNVYYLVSLYNSIRSDVERQVMTAMADADIDDMWERADRANRGRVAAAQAAKESGDTLPEQHERGVSGVKDEDGNFVTTSTDQEGNVVVTKKPLRRDRSYTNQMVNDMSQQMHANMDPYVDFNLAIMDSILLERLADRRIYPGFLAVEVVNSNGAVLRGNSHVPKSSSDCDVFTLCFNPDADMYYRAYMTPLTRHIFSEMAGVIVTVFLLMVAFALAFAYLLRTVARLRTIEEMKDDFVSNMTHELKTPIAIAYSANDALLNYDTGNDTEKREKYLKIANKQLKRLEEMVEGILSMSMERRKAMRLKPEEIQLRPFIEEIAAAQRMRTDKDIDIKVDVARDARVEVDRTHFANVLNNLIDNAIKYAHDSVRITVRGDSGGVSVEDNGIGIPARAIPFVFDKFYRVPRGNLHDVRGYGIGLYYVKGIVDRMGWTVAAASREGEGSVFRIKFGRNERQDTAR